MQHAIYSSYFSQVYTYSLEIHVYFTSTGL